VSEHLETFKTLIDWPNGVSSHDTIARVIGVLDLDEFDRCFERFTNASYG
jgi:hypothetical protein